MFATINTIIMAKIERFEDVKAWQEARVLVRKVYKLTDENSPFQ